ncbi:MAG: thermonuclease family protein [Hyphomicrobiales bacterium]
MRRPLPRSLADAVVLIVLLALLLMALQRAGWIDLGTGSYEAVDGDSLRRGDTEIRLYGIDSPEYRQICSDGNGRDYACGKEAATALRALLRGQTVTCSSIETDRYGRAIASCKAGDLDLNGEMVRLGWAVAYTRHSAGYVSEEAEARAAKRGLWQGRFENPQAWRERHRHQLVRGDVGMDGAVGED